MANVDGKLMAQKLLILLAVIHVAKCSTPMSDNIRVTIEQSLEF